MQHRPDAARPPSSDWLAAASALVAPPACVACRRPPEPRRPTRCARRAARRCRGCAARAVRGARCRRRAGRAARRRAARSTRAWAPVAFEGPARALVHALKFRGALAVAGPHGRADRRHGAGRPARGRGRARARADARRPSPAGAGSTTPRGWPHAVSGALAARSAAVCAAREPRRARLGARRAAAARAGRVRVEVCAARPGPSSCSSTTCTRPARRSTLCAARCAPPARARCAALTYARALCRSGEQSRRYALPCERPRQRTEGLDADRGQGSQHLRHRRAPRARGEALPEGGQAGLRAGPARGRAHGRSATRRSPTAGRRGDALPQGRRRCGRATAPATSSHSINLCEEELARQVKRHREKRRGRRKGAAAESIRTAAAPDLDGGAQAALSGLGAAGRLVSPPNGRRPLLRCPAWAFSTAR